MPRRPRRRGEGAARSCGHCAGMTGEAKAARRGSDGGEGAAERPGNDGGHGDAADRRIGRTPEICSLARTPEIGSAEPGSDSAARKKNGGAPSPRFSGGNAPAGYGGRTESGETRKPRCRKRPDQRRRKAGAETNPACTEPNAMSAARPGAGRKASKDGSNDEPAGTGTEVDVRHRNTGMRGKPGPSSMRAAGKADDPYDPPCSSCLRKDL